ncbi:hypothetical protein L8P27_05185 [Enterobacter asburiae]|uniref:hypothetical protein n=1 Tax=Enterobacter asburiae TaxID=61645 RepID=UPI0020053E4B|nr:hypothetical protein [Enterobacter asburiae]MCK7227246.1 hypothetical protein [Enterobacter asburiae]
MPDISLPKCTNFWGFPRSTVGKTQNYARMVLKGKNDHIINNIFSKVMRLLDNKLYEYRLESVSIGNHLLSSEIKARKGNDDISSGLQFGFLSHPCPPPLDSWLYPHYLLEAKRLECDLNRPEKYKFNINKAVEFRKRIFEENRDKIAGHQVMAIEEDLKKIEAIAKKVNKINAQINRMVDYAKKNNLKLTKNECIEQKFLNSLRPSSFC